MSAEFVLFKDDFFIPLENRDKFRDRMFNILRKSLDNSLSHQLVYVVDELITNAEEYGYERKKGEIKLKIVKCKNHIRIELKDKGKMPPLNEKNELNWNEVIQRGRGLGLYSIRKIVDSINFYKRGKWNVYMLRKKLR